jgi:hypothetical protein
MIWVIDSSVAVRWFLKTEQHPHADAIMEQVIRQTDQFMAPELFAFEVYAVLCRLHPKGCEVFIECVMPFGGRDISSADERQSGAPGLFLCGKMVDQVRRLLCGPRKGDRRLVADLRRKGTPMHRKFRGITKPYRGFARKLMRSGNVAIVEKIKGRRYF